MIALMFHLIVQFILVNSNQVLVTHRIKFSTKQHPLPISVSSLALQTSLTKLILKICHLTKNNTLSQYPRGITAYIHNSTELSATHLSQLKSLFMISQDNRFQIYIPQLKSILISDPNDRVCTEQIQHLFKYFYPCINYANLKLQKLINPSKLLEQYLAVQFLWDISNFAIEMSITLPKDKATIQDSSKYTACGHISIFETNNNQLNYQDKVGYFGRTINRWYSPNKLISHTFTLTKIAFNSTIKLLTMLPYGFIYQSQSLYPKHMNFELVKQEKAQGLFLQYTFNLLPIQEQKQFTLNINFHSSLPPFQYFQTIAGGGQQIMNVPLFIYNQTTYQLHSSIISQRLLQPDFSIPFQTITFTIGIFGYLWINLWRIHKTKLNQQNLYKKKCI